MDGLQQQITFEPNLVDQFCKRDPFALVAIYDRYAPSVYPLLLRITHEENIAEDLLQELFLHLWNRAHLFERNGGGLGVWLLATARSMAIDQMRLRAARSQRHAPMNYLRLVSRAKDDREWVLQSSRGISKVLGDVGNEERKVLELAYFEGLSQSEIAKLLDQPLCIVKTWMRSALNRLGRKTGRADCSPSQAEQVVRVDL